MRGAGLLIILLIILGVGALGVTGTVAPSRLAVIQEQVLGLVHGGIVRVEEQPLVDNCVQIEGQEGLRNINRVRRIVYFADGASLEIIYRSPPTENANC